MKKKKFNLFLTSFFPLFFGEKQAGTQFLMAVLVFALLSKGCASASNRTKSLITIAGAGLVGGVVGFATAPDNTLPMAHAALWGSTTATAAAFASLFIFDEQKRSAEFQRELEVSKKLNSLCITSETENPLLESTASLDGLKDSGNSEYSKLIRPGNWSVYKINQWVPQGSNTLIHQDKMIKIVLPQINPDSLKEGALNHIKEN